MFDLSLLISLPKPNAIDTASLTLKMLRLNYGRLPLFGLMEHKAFCCIFRRTLSWLLSCWMMRQCCSTRHSGA